MNMRESPPRATLEACVRREPDLLWGDEKECGWWQVVLNIMVEGTCQEVGRWGSREDCVYALISKEEHHKIYHLRKLISWSHWSFQMIHRSWGLKDGNLLPETKQLHRNRRVEPKFICRGRAVPRLQGGRKERGFYCSALLFLMGLFGPASPLP